MIVFALVACGPSQTTIGGGGDSGADTGEPTEETGEAGAPAYVNEVMARNLHAVQSPSGTYSDWIELYNPGGSRLDLDGWTITDDLDEPDRHTLSGVAIEAGGHLLLYADDAPDLGGDHLGFALDEAGEAVGLYDPDGAAIDGLLFGLQVPDVALARETDGGVPWILTGDPTPGAPNGGN